MNSKDLRILCCNWVLYDRSRMKLRPFILSQTIHLKLTSLANDLRRKYPDMKSLFNNSNSWRISSSEIYRLVVLVRTDVSEARIASIFRVRNQGAKNKLAVASDCITLGIPTANVFLFCRLCSLWWLRRYVTLVLRKSQGDTTQKTTFFIVIAVITSNLT
jgi:hypothetical protein